MTPAVRVVIALLALAVPPAKASDMAGPCVARARWTLADRTATLESCVSSTGYLRLTCGSAGAVEIALLFPLTGMVEELDLPLIISVNDVAFDIPTRVVPDKRAGYLLPTADLSSDAPVLRELMGGNRAAASYAGIDIPLHLNGARPAIFAVTRSCLEQPAAD